MGLRVKMDTFLVVPEEVVEDAAKAIEDDPLNNFKKVWNAGQEFKAAGLTPIYLLDQNFMDLFVIAKETYKKKLH
jgi:hypothetical protein